MKGKWRAFVVIFTAAYVLTGCGAISSPIEYDSADAAKEALQSASVLTVECNLEDADPAGNLLADGKIAGFMKNTGFINLKWTVSVDDVDWFYLKIVTDEPINDVEGIVSGTTYAYYDIDDTCLGYSQEQVIDGAFFIAFLDADGNRKDYLASEDGTVLFDSSFNVIGRAKGQHSILGSDCQITVTMEDGVDQEVDLKDKLAMTMPIYDEEKRWYLDNK